MFFHAKKYLLENSADVMRKTQKQAYKAVILVNIQKKNNIIIGVRVKLIFSKHIIAFLSQTNQLAECSYVNHAANLATLSIASAA
jgi:Cu2+-containing amine oxidase